MNDTPKDDGERSIWGWLWDNLVAGCKGLLKIILLVGVVVWVQQYPEQAEAFLRGVVHVVSEGFYFLRDAASAIRTEVIPTTN